MIDVKYDKRIHVKVVQLGPEEWIAWNFYRPKDLKTHFPWNCMAQFHNVWRLKIVRFEGNLFCKCDSLEFEELGFPCSFFFAVFGDMDETSINVQHFKVYQPFFADGTELGKALCQKQELQYRYEGKGIPITNEMLAKAQGQVSGISVSRTLLICDC